jgi:hypothetical protein
MPMIKLRLDVDYAYPSRLKSFLFTALNVKIDKNYLKNSKIIAKMINESKKDVKAYWFFTPYTTPDGELLALLHPLNHEVALHVATHPALEMKKLEDATKRKLKFYTVHGTARIIARLMWRRKIWEDRAEIPPDFPLKSFYDFPTLGLDRLSYRRSKAQTVKMAEEAISQGKVLHVHPEWLFQQGTLNHRGPYYETLKELLQVDNELEFLATSNRGFAKLAKYPEQFEYIRDFVPSEKFFEKLAERGIDIFTFVERKWCCSITNPPEKWSKSPDNIAIIKISNYNDWWSSVGKKTRNMVRKAEKNGIKTQVIEPSAKLAENIQKIYNEIPIRQGRAFSHYNTPLEEVERLVLNAHNSTFIGAFLENELVGFVQLVHGDNITVMAQILSQQKFWDKAVNNALVAKAIEICSNKNVSWLMYGRMGNHPSLDNFKESNGFSMFTLTRYYVPLTRKGKAVIKLRLHREIKDALPQQIKGPLIPVFNWISRIKARIRTQSKPDP